jgi:hypothetical protein
MINHTIAAMNAIPVAVTPAAIPPIPDAPSPWFCDLTVSSMVLEVAEKLDERAVVRNKEVVGIKAEVDMAVEGVEVGVKEDEVVRAGRKELSGLFENITVAMSKSCELHAVETARTKPTRGQLMYRFGVKGNYI